MRWRPLRTSYTGSEDFQKRFSTIEGFGMWGRVPVMSTLVRSAAASRFLGRQFAKMPSPKRLNAASWVRARAEWDHGRVREGWLKAARA